MNKKLSMLVIAVLSVLLTATVFPAIEAGGAVQQSTSGYQSNDSSPCDSLKDIIDDWQDTADENLEKFLETGNPLYFFLWLHYTQVLVHLNNVYNKVCLGSATMSSEDIITLQTTISSLQTKADILAESNSMDVTSVSLNQEIADLQSLLLNLPGGLDQTYEVNIAGSSTVQSTECGLCASR